MAVSQSLPYREIRGDTGRVFRVGEDPKELLGRSRSYMIWLPWVAMLTGGVLCLIAFLTIANTGNMAVVIAGYSVLGGIGAGLVYASCINIVAKWFPERKGWLTGFVNGGFAYGSIPFIIIFNYWFTPANHSLVLSLVGVYMLVLMVGCGWFFADPPRNWWPASVDPVNWGRDEKARRNLLKNPPAARQFTPAEATRTPQLWIMWVALICTSGVSFFGINFEVKFAKASNFGLYVAVISAILLALVSGSGRAGVGWISDRLGRRQTLLADTVLLAVAMYGVGWSGSAQNEPLFFVFAVIAGPVGAAIIDGMGYPATYALAGSLSLLAGGLVLLLRRPATVADVAAPPQAAAAAS